jgi:hypothetical protein
MKVLALILSHINPFGLLSNKCKSLENLSGRTGIHQTALASFIFAILVFSIFKGCS